MKAELRTVKCMYCTKRVRVTHKGRVAQHANMPRKVCLGSGQPALLHAARAKP